MAPTQRSAPEPAGEEASHSGRLLLRMPPSLHAELAREAEREGVSLNAFIASALAGAVRWRAPDGGAPDPAAQRSARLLRAAIAVDVVLVAIATALAVALLIVAWP